MKVNLLLQFVLIYEKSLLRHSKGLEKLDRVGCLRGNINNLIKSYLYVIIQQRLKINITLNKYLEIKFGVQQFQKNQINIIIGIIFFTKVVMIKRFVCMELEFNYLLQF